MSMKSWSEDGYGFALYTGKNLDRIKDFLIANRNCSKYFEDISDDSIREAEDDQELRDVFDAPASYVIADIINFQTGRNDIRGYNSCGETGQEEMLGITSTYPWVGVKPLSQAECDALLQKYAEMLGISDAPDYFDAEYFG